MFRPSIISSFKKKKDLVLTSWNRLNSSSLLFYIEQRVYRCCISLLQISGNFPLSNKCLIGGILYGYLKYISSYVTY